MYPSAVCFILGSDAGQDRVRSAFDMARFMRENGTEASVAVEKSPFSAWMAQTRGVPAVWMGKMLPLVFNPVKLSKTFTHDHILLLPFGKKAADVASMAARLVSDKDIRTARSWDNPGFLRPDTPPRAEKPSDGGLTVVYFGEITPQSPVEEFIQAMAGHGFENVRLRVAGTGLARHVMPLVRLASSTGVADRIEWLGDVDDLAAESAAADVALTEESRPDKQSFAASCGLPVAFSAREAAEGGHLAEAESYRHSMLNLLELFESL